MKYKFVTSCCRNISFYQKSFFKLHGISIYTRSLYFKSFNLSQMNANTELGNFSEVSAQALNKYNMTLTDSSDLDNFH